MKYFRDEEHDSMRDYEFSTTKHNDEYDEHLRDEFSLFGHGWIEDYDSMEDYEFSTAMHDDY